ncbi:ArsR family transcriptional regulator [Pseudoalteromonas sp. SR45-5]|uniref:ArsR family transcriptional regulator n=1 Tax=Pseudoalteromonas sp. SR45-5 TaxID=2760928 RepID=UPI0015F82E30|nr:ArsR family transcriptional regulator [Pseudoalteromonas sp. SR45-5]MBB1354387.1 ArsR family transcriptional regulator [Pseudoalteromonas sp. SR45-5]
MKVSNPLTIVAIFAGTAETFATGALVALPESMQAIFIYFVMFFPVLIVVCFFLTLAMKPQSLYAPSDFSNEEHFLDANKLKQAVSKETESVLKEAKANNELTGDVKLLSEKVANLTLKNLEASVDKKVLDFLTKHPKQAFENRGLGHILQDHKRSILESLIRLEGDGKIISGMDGEVKVWQVKI